MKKTLFLIVFFLAAAFSFAIEHSARSIFIEGTAEQEAHAAFFMSNFTAEAAAMGLTIAEYKEEAEFTFRFYVQRHYAEYDPAINYIVLIALYDNQTETEIVFFGWPFAELEDMHAHNQQVFYTAVALIPGIVRDELDPLVLQVPIRDNRWQANRFLMRISVDYPIAFYVLQPTGLFQNMGAYGPDPAYPTMLIPLDNLIMPRPGITVGFEWLFHPSWSVEAIFQGNFGDPATVTFLTMGAGIRFSYIHRTRNFMLQPYGAFSMPLTVSPEFTDFPPFAAGLGIQVGVRGVRDGIFFIDVNIMASLGEVYRRNPYTGLAPYPRRIHYRRFAFGLGIGYKFWPFRQR